MLSAEEITRKREEKKQQKAQKKLSGAQRNGTVLLCETGGKKRSVGCASSTPPPPTTSMASTVVSSSNGCSLGKNSPETDSDHDGDEGEDRGESKNATNKNRVLRHRGVLRELHSEEISVKCYPTISPTTCTAAAATTGSVVVQEEEAAASSPLFTLSQLDLLDILQIATATYIQRVVVAVQEEGEEDNNNKRVSNSNSRGTTATTSLLLKNPTLPQWLGVALRISEPFIKINVSPCCTLHEVHAGGRRVAYFLPSRRYFYDLGPAPSSSFVSAQTAATTTTTATTVHHHEEEDEHQEEVLLRREQCDTKILPPKSSSQPLVALTLPFSPNWNEEGQGKNVMIKQRRNGKNDGNDDGEQLIPVMPVKNLIREQLVMLVTMVREELLLTSPTSVLSPKLVPHGQQHQDEAEEGNHQEEEEPTSALVDSMLEEIHDTVYDDLCVLVKDYFHVLLVTAKNVISTPADTSSSCDGSSSPHHHHVVTSSSWDTAPLTRLQNPAVIGTRFNSTAQRDLKWNRKREPGLISTLVVRRETMLLPPKAIEKVVEKIIALSTRSDSDNDFRAKQEQGILLVEKLKQQLGSFQPISIGRKDRLPFKLSYKFFSTSLRGGSDGEGKETSSCRPATHTDLARLLLSRGDDPATNHHLSVNQQSLSPPPPPSLPALAGAWVAEWSRNWTCFFPTLFIATKEEQFKKEEEQSGECEHAAKQNNISSSTSRHHHHLPMLADDLSYKPSEDHPEGDPRLGATHPMSCQDSFYLFEDAPWKLRRRGITTTNNQSPSMTDEREEGEDESGCDDDDFYLKWPHFQSAKLFAEWLAAQPRSSDLSFKVEIKTRLKGANDDLLRSPPSSSLLRELRSSVASYSAPSARVLFTIRILRSLLVDLAQAPSPEALGRSDSELLQESLKSYDHREKLVGL